MRQGQISARFRQPAVQRRRTAGRALHDPQSHL